MLAAWVVASVALCGLSIWLAVSLVRERGAHDTTRAHEAELVARIRTLEKDLAAANEELEVASLPGPDPRAELDGTLSAALTDNATGLFNEQFFRVTLETRVSAARRHLRPVAVVLLQVARGVREGTPASTEPSLVAEGIRSTLRDADTACRLEDGRFALILEDTPENGAVWTVERIRRALAASENGHTLWAGIACYPAHAFDAWELLDRSARALDAAREWHQDRIEVATAE